MWNSIKSLGEVSKNSIALTAGVEVCMEEACDNAKLLGLARKAFSEAMLTVV